MAKADSLDSAGRGRLKWSYYVAVDEIYHAKWSSLKKARIQAFREAIGHFWPEGHPSKLIQVAGTSGKGSTCQFLRSGLSEYGRAGCYVKPAVFDFAERFAVGDGQAGHDEIVRSWSEVEPFCVRSASRGDSWAFDFFEVSLLVALKIFEKRRLDWAVIETGIGGRYDCTRALEVVATVLTNVGQDHEEVLGVEHWQRALDKAGICRPGVPLFLGDADDETASVVRGVCREVGAPYHRLERRDVQGLKKAVGGGQRAAGVALLDSEYQMLNASLAMKTILSLVPSASIEALAKSFTKAKFLGRFWMIEKGVYADVAHNPSKTRALSEDLKRRFPGEKLILVVGISGSRDPVAVLGPLVPRASAVVVTAAGFKGQDPEVVYSRLHEAYPELRVHFAPNPQTSLSVAKSLRGNGEKVLFTGSTYMIDQALNPDEKLRHLNGTMGWRDLRQKQVEGKVSFALPEKTQ
ncbi:MAG TPA: hypothetical protein VEJ36_00020 [Nitrososphaerales archaeon]|nr:hypothetical protein [Nitrososphaerales archaeon]